tara:strand:+ start:17236 stop:17436 length:201 start_codon:yes stop_codon:yes gene_type:complete
MGGLPEIVAERGRQCYGKEAALGMQGTVVEPLAATKFTSQIGGGHYRLAHISGKMRKRRCSNCRGK